MTMGWSWHILIFLGVLAAAAEAVTVVNGTSSPLERYEGTIYRGDLYVIPMSQCNSFGLYPNPLGLDSRHRRHFHPVVKFPQKWAWQEPPPASFDGTKKSKRRHRHKRKRLARVADVTIIDHTISSGLTQLATPEQRERRQQELNDMSGFQKLLRQLAIWTRQLRQQAKTNSKRQNNATRGLYGIGRYDENRAHMYSSEMFQDTNRAVDGYKGARTVHIGIDLDGPLYTKVHAFTHGIIHSVGYKADLGDYGNVIVIEHDLPKYSKIDKVWALYGHLDNHSIQNKNVGQRIKRGQVLGQFGDIHENGGWTIPHVHFQLSLHPPETHDMPGAVSLDDRSDALVHYPDPRYVLGALH